MLRFYIPRVLAYVEARLIILAVWWFSPQSLLPVIDWNGSMTRGALDYLVAVVAPPWDDYVREFLYITDKVGDLIQLWVHWYVSAEIRDHVEVLARAFFTPGGWLILVQLTLIIFVMIRVRRAMFERYALRKRRRAELDKSTL